MHFTRLKPIAGYPRDTHQASFFQKIWREVRPAGVIVDPFARDCTLADAAFRNDINPKTHAFHHLDAIDFFVKILDHNGPGFADFIIYDPPFSQRQLEEKYDGELVNMYTVPGYVKNVNTLACLCLRPGGRLLKFGYNSNKVGSLDFEAGWLQPTGGNSNDVIISLWKQNQKSLTPWLSDSKRSSTHSNKVVKESPQAPHW